MSKCDPRNSIDRWFWDFATRLMDRIRRGDWPEQEAEYWGTLKRSFVLRGVNEAVADDASVLLAEEPPKGLDGVLPGILGHCRAIWKSNEISHKAELTGGDSDRMRAEMESKDCDRCAGSGLTEIFRLKSAVQGRNNAVTVYCTCRMGQLLCRVQMTANQDSRDFARRITNLADHPELQGDEYRHDPFAHTHEPFDPRAYQSRRKLEAVGAIPAASEVA